MIDPRAARFGDRVAWGMAYTASAVLAALVLMPIVAHPGIPAYQHDWSWPPDAGPALAGIIGHLSTWDSQGLGFPNALASSNPINLLIPLPAMLFDPGIALRIALIAAFATGAVGATRAASRIMNAPPWCAIASGLAYCTSPILLDNLGAGHIGFWCAYGILPWVVWLSFESVTANRKLPWLLGVCLLGSIITIQPQFLVFGSIAAMAGALMGNSRAALLPVGAFVLGGIVSLLPVLVALNGARSYWHLLYPHPQLGWERLLSTPWPDVVWTTNYVVPYYARANAAGIPYLQLFSIIALASILIIRPLRFALALALLAICGMFFATGVLGPAHSLWASLYANFYPATAFRDASSGASLVSLTYALAVGASWRRTYVAAPLMVLLAAASAPFLFGATTAIAENVLLPRETAIHTMVAQLPQGRIASVPLAAPVIFENRPGGIDVDAIADSDHPSLAEYPTLPPLTTIASSKFDSLWVLDALSRMGVVAIVRRPGFSSGDLARQGIAQDAPEAPGLQVLAPDGLISFDRASQSEPLTFKTILPAGVAGLDSPSGPMPPKAPNGPVEVEDLQSAPLGDDPATGWALLTRWYALDSALSTTGRGVLTQSVEPLSLTLRAGEWWLLHSGGRLSITSGTRRQIMPASPTPRWDAVESNGRVVLRSLDGEAVAYRFARGRTAGVPRLRFAVASATYSVPVPWHVDVSAKSSARGPWLLVFRVRYSPYWHVAGAAVLWHGLADGFANGFILTTLPAQFSIDYEPQRPFMAACAGVWLFQLGLGALCLRSRRRGGQHSPSGDGDRSTAIPDARPPRDA